MPPPSTPMVGHVQVWTGECRIRTLLPRAEVEVQTIAEMTKLTSTGGEMGWEEIPRTHIKPILCGLKQRLHCQVCVENKILAIHSKTMEESTYESMLCKREGIGT